MRDCSFPVATGYWGRGLACSKSERTFDSDSAGSHAFSLWKS